MFQMSVKGSSDSNVVKSTILLLESEHDIVDLPNGERRSGHNGKVSLVVLQESATPNVSVEITTTVVNLTSHEASQLQQQLKG